MLFVAWEAAYQRLLLAGLLWLFLGEERSDVDSGAAAKGSCHQRPHRVAFATSLLVFLGLVYVAALDQLSHC